MHLLKFNQFSDNVVKAANEMMLKPWEFFFFWQDHRKHRFVFFNNAFMVPFCPESVGLQLDKRSFWGNTSLRWVSSLMYMKKFLSKQKYLAGDICYSFYNDVNVNILHLCTFFLVRRSLVSSRYQSRPRSGWGDHTSRPLSCRFLGICLQKWEATWWNRSQGQILCALLSFLI